GGGGQHQAAVEAVVEVLVLGAAVVMEHGERQADAGCPGIVGQGHLAGLGGAKPEGGLPDGAAAIEAENDRVHRRAVGVLEVGAVGAVLVDRLGVNFFVGLVDDGAVAVGRIKIGSIGWHGIVIE